MNTAQGVGFTVLMAMFLLQGQRTVAQTFEVRSIEINTEGLILHYDLLDTTRNRTYTVNVYSSHDSFLAPLTKVTGDAGLEVRPGFNRRIVWDAKSELGATFDGDVELEIKARVFVPFLRFEGFQTIEIRKRTVPFLVKWSGGSRQNILDFQLWQNGKKVYTFPNIPNTGEYRLTIPSSVRPGHDYYLRIADSKNTDQVVMTSKFTVKRKIPVALKLLPLLGAGYLAYSLGQGSSGPQETPPIDPAPGVPK